MMTMLIMSFINHKKHAFLEVSVPGSHQEFLLSSLYCQASACYLIQKFRVLLLTTSSLWMYIHSVFDPRLALFGEGEVSFIL